MLKFSQKDYFQLKKKKRKDLMECWGIYRFSKHKPKIYLIIG
jgi:hypothetical protein